MKITTNKNIKADFYIARVGSKAGKPMLTDYTSTNAFSVVSAAPEADFQKAMHLYKSGKVNAYVIGTAQPTIRKRDMQLLLDAHIVNSEVLDKLEVISNLIAKKELELEKLRELEKVLTRLK